MRKRWSRSLSLATGIAFMAVSAQAGNLIAPLAVDSPSAKAWTNDRAYVALTENPTTAAIRPVNADSRQVTLKTSTISLALGEGLDLRARRVDSYVSESGSLVWSGVILGPGANGMEFDSFNTVILVKNGRKITGNVHYQGQLYEIRPLKKRGHVVVTVDNSRRPPEHPPEINRLPFISMPIAEEREAPNLVTAASGNTVITALVNYTPSAASASGDINGLIDLAVAESNQGYANSGVAITLQLLKKSQTTYTESGSFNTDLTRYRSTSDGYMGYIHTERNQHGADVAVLLINNSSSCGLASGIGSSVSTAFAVAHWGCATGYYSFAHEIGHLQSARHDPATDSTNTPYAYGHGYRYSWWRTIMAYDCPAGGCYTRLNYWSNPNVLYNGVPMGTVTTHDNARVLNNTRGTVAGFKTASGCVPDGGADDTLGNTSCCSGTAVNGSTYCSNPGDWYTTWASCNHICGTPLVNGCVPSGGVDDTLSRTSCCSGQAVSGSTWCLDPADYGTDWQTCAQICR